MKEFLFVLIYNHKQCIFKMEIHSYNNNISAQCS